MVIFITNLEWKVPYPEGISTEKPVDFCPAIIELWMCEYGILLVPVKYTFVCCASALAVLGHTTHYRVA